MPLFTEGQDPLDQNRSQRVPEADTAFRWTVHALQQHALASADTPEAVSKAALGECATLWQTAADVMSGPQREEETAAQFVKRVAMMRHVIESSFLARAPAQVLDIRAQATAM
jgi:hypothetical protein